MLPVNYCVYHPILPSSCLLGRLLLWNMDRFSGLTRIQFFPHAVLEIYTICHLLHVHNSMHAAHEFSVSGSYMLCFECVCPSTACRSLLKPYPSTFDVRKCQNPCRRSFRSQSDYVKLRHQSCGVADSQCRRQPLVEDGSRWEGQPTGGLLMCSPHSASCADYMAGASHDHQAA